VPLPVALTKDTTLPEWRLLTITKRAYVTKPYATAQTINNTLIYPTISASPVLNTYFLSSVDKALKTYINSETTSSRAISIHYDYGENAIMDDGLEATKRTELVFYSDAIVTYKSTDYLYFMNGYRSESYISLNTANGQQIKIGDIFQETHINTVLTMLQNKYKTVLRNDYQEKQNIGEMPYYKSYNQNTELFLTPKGIYFRERLYKLAPYYDLFLPYEEVKNYLKADFKKVVEKM
jgi:hypothetical protein